MQQDETSTVAPASPSLTPANAQSGQQVYQAMVALPLDAQKDILTKTLGSLNVHDQDEVAQGSGLQSLSQRTQDLLWKSVILGAVVVFLAASAAMIIAVFAKVDVTPLTTMFTALIAFIGGLMAPSPAQAVARAAASNTGSSSKVTNQ